MRKLTVGQLAEAAGTTRRAIRFYEEVGLLIPERDPNGYRRYTDEHIIWLKAIKMLRESGYSVKNLCLLIQIKRSDIPSADKIHSVLTLIEQVSRSLLEQRQALDLALQRLEIQRQECLDRLAQIGLPCDASPSANQFFQTQIEKLVQRIEEP
jgi:DNA-binding transcriptional MerR regulator